MKRGDVNGPFIMPIVDKFKEMGTAVMGRVESGHAKKGQTLLVMPNKTSVVVDQLWCDDDEVPAIIPGQNVRIKLKGVDEENISRGFVLCHPSRICGMGRVFDVQVYRQFHSITNELQNLVVKAFFMLQVYIIEHKSIICAGYSAVCHIHSAAEEVTVMTLICTIDKKTNEKSSIRPRFIKQGQLAIIRLQAAGVICMEAYKDFPQMSRFTLRNEGTTIAIGKVLKVIE